MISVIVTPDANFTPRDQNRKSEEIVTMVAESS